MQRSKGTEVKIPPNLLKNFNAYEMLEPQKNGANSDVTTVDKLIDIDDSSRDSGFQDSDLHPAFFDKNRDFDLVDLYQNIFVTPQHIKKTEFSFDIETSDTTSSDSNVVDDGFKQLNVMDAGFKHSNVSDAGFKHSNVSDAGFKHSNVSDAGFKQFFDVLESGQKVDWTNIPKPEEEIISKHDFIEKKPKVLVPKVFTEPDADPDLVYEVLAQKNMEKLILDSVRDASKNYSSPKVNSSEPKERESPKIQKSDIVPELSRFYSVNGIAKGSFGTGTDEKIPHPSETESPKIQKSDVVPELSRFYSVNSIAKGSFGTGTDEKIPRPSETYMKNNSSSNFIVRTIQKDEKVYKKKCVKKPKSQTADFNRGPDFDEKKIVLPQIMARLDARLAYLHERENQKKRLILDTSSKPETAEEATNVNAEVKPKNQVLSNMPKPKAQVMPTKKESKVLHIASSSGIHSLNNNMKIQEEAQLCINKISKDIRVHTTDRTCLNCGKSPINKVENPVATSSKTDYGKLSPIVLMEDCNRERLRALKQSQMFKNFVLKGEFGPFIYE